MRCTRYKKVRMKGNGLVKRCAKYAGRKRTHGYRKRSSAKRRTSGYRRPSAKRRASGRHVYRRGHRPFNKGKHCIRFKTNKRGIRTCASYGGTPRGAAGYAKWWGSALDQRNRERVAAPTSSVQDRLRAYKASKFYGQMRT